MAGKKSVPVRRHNRSTPSDAPYKPGKKPGPKTVRVVPHKRTPTSN